MSETFSFDTDISALLKLIINNFYSNKDIFLRELISNASDSIDKYNHFCIVEKPEDKVDNCITIIPDKENKTLHIIDTGIGMNKEELIKNIGTIANSGTKAFMESVKDSSLIGQFGVGFYSAFLVAKEVSIITKKTDSGYFKWTSDAGGKYEIEELTEETLKDHIHPDYELTQGTIIKCMLTDEAIDNYTNINKIKSIIKEHSQYINYPIKVFTKREETKEVEDSELCSEDAALEEEVSVTEKNTSDTSNLEDCVIEDVDETEKPEKPKKMKQIVEVIKEFELINEHKPLWTRPSNEITEDEYNSFYKSLTSDNEKPYTYKHISGEGQIEYKGILYLPKKITNNVFERGVKQNNIKLYVRKIFVSDNSAVLCPEWLHFIAGIVDTDDLPLNVSREILQENKVIKVIKKAVVKKSIDMLKSSMNDMDNYTKMYKTYQKNIKLGVYEESGDRERVADLLMFYSANSPDKMITFDDYITAMNENQKHIYYIAGDNMEILKSSPFIDRFTKNGFDVLFMTDPVDEYMCQRLVQYKECTLTCITKGDIELPNTSESDKDLLKKQQEDYKPLCDYIKRIYSNFTDVKITNKIYELPCIVSSPENGFSANMEKIIKSQTLGQTDNSNGMLDKRVLEINPLHPIIKKIKNINDTVEYNSLRDLLDLVINSALLYSGYTIIKPVEFSKKILNVVMLGMDIDGTEEPEAPDVPKAPKDAFGDVETIDMTNVD
jgi:molecular chaperone HtpG